MLAMKKIHWENTEKKRDDFDELIPCIEKAFLLTFPEDFKTCAIENGGGSPSPCRFNVENKKEKKFTKLLSLNPRSKDFFWRHYVAAGWHPLGYRGDPYPIAQDAEGNYICLDYEGCYPPKIVYVTAKWATTGWKTIISDSFSAFLKMLY
ncbi:hypothetical protein J2129_001871 [Methanofollis sp. W23]|uniref:SMI1/KNR4 family protein n=1 Tax=Methanofollis sp. W23 TaxID=2817849 RepID=UPI001AE8B15C|nr:SMI1/KNR4 family protein [Methanofollis sp. W23]MBP2146417.1 hypothetical protein [Methanofollis sp. W23]